MKTSLKFENKNFCKHDIVASLGKGAKMSKGPIITGDT